MKTTINKALIVLLMGFILIKTPVYADEVDLDYPHCSTYDYACLSCHYMFEDLYTIGWPDWVTTDPDPNDINDIDVTPYNNLCKSCHNDITAPDVNTHSSGKIRDWSIECRTCHDPHHQWQFWEYGEESYSDSSDRGTSTSISDKTLTKTGAGWDPNQYQGFILIPNLDPNNDNKLASYNYKIIANTSDTLYIDGYMNKRVQDFERVDPNFTIFPWSTGGDADWTTQDTNRRSPEYAAEAPRSLEDNQMSYLQARLKITEAGNISFWYKVSSQPDDDYLRFLIDGEEQGRWSGEVDWTQTQESYSVSADWHTFRWEYTKGSSDPDAGSDTAWIDDITFPTKETVTSGNSFAIIYGKLIRDEISTPNSGKKTVKFFDPNGDNSFADGDSTYDGVCEVCHTQTTHFRNNSTGDDPLHTNVGEGEGQAGTNCINCHSHDNGFKHGGGGGAGCSGPSCHGGTGSHATHTQSNSKGPATLMTCGDCHDTNNYPYFGDPGEAKLLADTDVCDSCHSEGGLYNGINDSGDSIGAKDNWDEVYDPNDSNVLLEGKEKWCVGCHDGGISVIDDANAPNTDMYYTGGHGRVGVAKKCSDCHDISKTHIDGEARTYAFNSAYYGPTQSGVAYAAGYRLRYVDGNVPLMIPANYNITFNYDAATMKNTAFRLCFASGCHADVFEKIFDNTSGDGIRSNFKASLPNPPRNYSYAWGSGADTNEHVAHIMNYIGPFCDSDWDTGTTGAGGSNGCDTMAACFACHNVHGSSGTMGSTNEPMIRDGRLAGRTSYGFSFVIEDGDYPQVTSTGANQANSVGSIFRNNTANMCGGSMCHGNPTPPAASSYDASGSSWGTYIEYYRQYQNY